VGHGKGKLGAGFGVRRVTGGFVRCEYVGIVRIGEGDGCVVAVGDFAGSDT
jgi:hypothetical protein